ncbi:terminase small subunit [Acinetobacter baumannii]|uniref:terminase small subunit n=1 Tax=Acinetobacter baumannii TaxID=470 RepID=UPI0007D8B660|nr:terminase small subunit [Acinetobacter baumannii]EKT7961154.1 terminase small subunit [Acinetobacter baumannii]EKU0427514.1 terminase small subunit [Acinetobacter baumannii]EKV4645857.1 terminase small subunit [Acinetobacter baumannii]EKV6479701.1 terminase small subunit [Acinetobacter baumannii]EKX7151832.1 terminase small subunit [Acinetobacter baumannii]
MEEQIKGAEPLKNLRHEEFCHEYLKTLSPQEAGKTVGFKTRQHAWEVLQREEVEERIAYLNGQRLNRIDIDADYVLRRLVEIDQMDVLDIMDDNFCLKPIGDWPKVWRQYVNSIENMEITDSSGWMRKIKWPDKVKNLELLGKHIAVGAFKESVEHKHSGKVDLRNVPDDDLDKRIKELENKVMPNDKRGET